MKLRLFAAIFLTLLLSGCAGFSFSTPTPLPTVVLDNLESENITPGFAASGGDVTASGVVVPARRAQLVFGMAGLVDTVQVRAGDRVESGQLLATLTGREKLSAALSAANYERLSARFVLNTLNENADSARIAAQLRLAVARKALDEAQKRRNWKQFRNGSQSDIDNAQADLILAKDALEKAEEAFANVADRAEDDVIRAGALSALGAARKARDRAQANLNYLLAMPNEIDVDQAEAELLVAQAEVADAEKEFERLQDGPDADAVALAQARIENAEAQVAASQAALGDLELRAPFAGVVSKVNLMDGEWTLPGQPVFELVDVTQLRVETTDLSERDVPRVMVGQSAVVEVEALNVVVSGRVSQISPLADSRGGDVIYTTTIELEEIPDGMRAGMSVVVRFQTRK